MSYVYVIRRPDTGELKIGISGDPVFRFKNLQTAHAIALEFLVAFEVVDPEGAEAAAHSLFSRHRLKGEWFRDAPEIRAWIASHPHAKTLADLVKRRDRPEPVPLPPPRPFVACEFTTRNGEPCKRFTRARARNAVTGQIRNACGPHADMGDWTRLTGSDE